MARTKTPQSSADEDGDIEMADSSSTLNVPKRARAAKKLKTQKSSDALDVEPTSSEPPRTKLVMVSVEGKRSPFKHRMTKDPSQPSITSWFTSRNSAQESDQATFPVRSGPKSSTSGTASSSRAAPKSKTAPKTRKAAPTKQVIELSGSSSPDIRPARRRGRKSALSDDEEDFIPADEPYVEEEDDDIVVSDDDGIVSEPPVYETDSEDNRDKSGDIVIFKKDGKVQKQPSKGKVVPCGLNIAPRKGDLPPLSNLELIFDDIISRPAEVKALMGPTKYRKLKVATMCSGTESPLLALDMFAKAIKNRGWGTLDIEHVFSCEIEPYKQAYIERNFKPPILFRDIREMGREEATTAYGAKMAVPGDVDMLIAGTSCVDFSNLNNKQKDITAGGESGDTFLGMMAFVKKHRPTIVIQENVCGAYWGEMRNYFHNAGYSAEVARVDAKHYYIPHTRTRGYLFALNNRQSDGPNRWVDAMAKMKRNSSTTFEAFMLPDDDPRVFKARVELAGDARTGPNAKSSRNHEWEKCEGRHQRERIDHHIGSQRPTTHWEEGGIPTLMDFQWQDWGRNQVNRVLDLMDINYLLCIQKGYDPFYKAGFWNLSQNVDRNTMGGIPKGISPCLTPTMIPYLTYRGGPMTGIESLHMQGLPINDLLLTRESTKQIQDMAGNAMSSTVVGTAMLMALILCRKDLKERPRPDGMELDGDSDGSIVNTIIGDDNLIRNDLDLSTTLKFDLDAVLKAAGLSARLCICEGRSTITKDKLRLCTECGFTACEKCGGRPEHVIADAENSKTVENGAENDDQLDADEDPFNNEVSKLMIDAPKAPTAEERQSPLVFERQIKNLIPMRLVLTNISTNTPDKLKDSSPELFGRIDNKRWMTWKQIFEAAVNSEFRFKTLLRHGTWVIIYESPTARLELILDQKKPEWRLYPICPQTEGCASLKRQLCEHPLARMFLTNDRDALAGVWEINMPTVYTFDLTVKGVGKTVPSYGRTVGLQDPQSLKEEVWDHIQFTVPKEAKNRLDIDISGTYKLLPKCGTAMGALHIKDVAKNSGEKSVFFFLDQGRIGDTSEDPFVFAHTFDRLQYGDVRPLLAKLQPSWRQFSGDNSHTVKCTVDGHWYQMKNAKLGTPVTRENGGIVKMPGKKGLVAHADLDSCRAASAILHCEVPLKNQAETVWPKGKWIEIDDIHERNTYESIAWLTERIRSVKQLGNWTNVDLPEEVHCERCSPTPPAMKWVFYNGRYTAFEDVEQAAPYERAVKHRPRPIVTHLFMDDSNRATLKIGLNVTTLFHRALARFPALGNVKKPKLSWRLATDYVPEPKVMLPFYALTSNKKDEEWTQPPNFITKLRPEQLRSLTWMMAQEADDAKPFMEEEVAEMYFPHLDWRLEGRAERPNMVKGGVLADEVGYGKTAISVGLIDCTQMDVKIPKNVKGAIPVKATIIVIPGHLSVQWPNEIRKFCGTKYKLLEIKNCGSMKNVTIKDVMKADIVLVSSSVFNSSTYHTNLAIFAGAWDVPDNDGRRFDDWHSSAQKNLADQVDVLRDQGAQAVLERIKEAGKLISKVSENEGFKQKKRLKGSAYTAQKDLARANKRKRDPNDPDDEGEATESDHEEEPEYEPMLPGMDLSDEDKKTSNDITDRSKFDPWKLKSSLVRDDWKNMAGPMLDMFKFNRLIVDEFTYLNGKVHRAITGLKADRRWVLSGTPPLEDFADVKTISVFMNLHLGIDDEHAESLKNNKKIKKDRTSVEQFTNFNEIRSPFWYNRRQEIAQNFLNQFVRQNYAEIDEIPCEEHLVPVHLPAAEHAIYLELDHYLQALEYKIRRSRAKSDNDRDRRQQEALGDSKTAEEALIKRCSHFELNVVKNEENAVQTCDMIVAERLVQLHDCREDIRRSLADAVKRHNEIPTQKFEEFNRRDIFEEFIRISKTEGTGDPYADIDILAMIAEATAKGEKPKVKYSDGTYADPEISEPTIMKKKTHAELVAEAKAAGRKAPTKKRPKVDKKTGEVIDEDAPIVVPWPKEMSEKIEQLKNKSFYLRTIVKKELVGRHRSLRYFTFVRDLQTKGLEQAKKNGGITDMECKACGRENLPLSEACVMSSCGHQGCYSCLAEKAKFQKCIVKKCEATTRPGAIVRAESLGTEQAEDSQGIHYGRKLEKVIELINERIPKNEKILLFVQFPDLYKKVAKVLEHYKINFLTIEGTAKRQGDQLSKFQDKNGPRVLLLNILQQSSAGSNLTNANHAILLSPLLTETEYEYKASETQAIGRVRRYGQTKTVHIWRFMTEDTMDVAIWQERTGKKLEECRDMVYDL